ncbi:MAG: hypothetical protein ACLP8S_10780 [Solirubrobacteraceae bacterium]
MAGRRAFADEYAVRVNRAVELLAGVSPADAVRALRAEHGLSERQARRYVNAARATPDGLVVPERTAVFTVRLAPSLIAGLRGHADARGLTLSATIAEAARLYLDRVAERHGGNAR